MGNICGRRKIIFIKPKTFATYKLNNLENEFYNIYRENYLKVEPKSVITTNSAEKIIKTESKKSHSLYSMDNNILISRSSPQDTNLSNSCIESSSELIEDLLFLDSSSSSSLEFATSSIQQSINNDQTAKVKEKLVKKFKKICLEVHIQDPINIQEVTFLLENAARITFASIVDIKNVYNNTAVSIAVLRNDTNLLQCLLKFMPDFPEFIYTKNSKLPLVQVAAMMTSENGTNQNILSIILQRWIDYDFYCSVALKNIFTHNCDSQNLFQFLIDQIQHNHQRTIQLMNLKLLFILFQKLISESHITEQNHPDIFNWCKNIDEGTFSHLEGCDKQENCSKILEKILIKTYDNEQY